MSHWKDNLFGSNIDYHLTEKLGLFQKDFIAQAWECSPLPPPFLYEERKKKSFSKSLQM